MHQTCKKCGRVQRFEFAVSDLVWRWVPEEYQYKALCIECFLELVEERVMVAHLNLRDFQFLGIVTPSGRLSGVLLDRNPKEVLPA